MMNKTDWTHLAINLAGDKGLTPAQLQKVLFLVKENFSDQLTDFYEFKPYNYGPFDKQVYVDAEVLASQGQVKLEKYPGRSWVIYRANPESSPVTAENTEEKKIEKYLETVVKWSQSLTFEQLISSIYKKYPSYKVNSVFRG